MMNLAETSEGAFPLEVWRYEKILVRLGRVSAGRRA